MTSVATLTPTGIKKSFKDIPIGGIFFYHDRFWSRYEKHSAKDLDDHRGYGYCAFFVEPRDIEFEKEGDHIYDETSSGYWTIVEEAVLTLV